MNAKIYQTENNIQLLESELMRLGSELGNANNAIRYAFIEAEIAKVQQKLKDEFELLDELKA